MISLSPLSGPWIFPKTNHGSWPMCLWNADMRGIRSHGTARVVAFINRLEKGVINKNPQMKIRFGSDVTGTIDADNSLGAVAANVAIEEAMKRADRHGAGFVAVNNCSHIGYVGYWARKAMEGGFIGIQHHQRGGVVVPTFGIEPVLGTNPISVAFPGGPNGAQFSYGHGHFRGGPRQARNDTPRGKADSERVGPGILWHPPSG